MKKIILLVLVLAFGLFTEQTNADFTFGEPVNLKTVIPVIDPEYDVIDCFSYDGLETYFDSERAGGSGQWDLWVSRRASIDEDWGPPENLGPTVNTEKDDSNASISADGLTLYFSSDRPGGYGNFDIYMTTRATRQTPWGKPVNLGPEINKPVVGDAAPWVSTDNLELYFESYRSGGYGSADIYVARRATPQDPWGEPANLGSVVNSPYLEACPSLSPDGLVLFFADSFYPRPEGYGSADMWMTRRASLSDPWQTPVNLGPEVNGPDVDNPPRISPDGRGIYFFSGVNDDPTTWNNYQAPIIPICDLNGDGIVDAADMCIVVDHWGENYPLCDVGPMPWGDGVVDVQDLIVLAEHLFEESPLNEDLCPNNNPKYLANDYIPLNVDNFWQYHCTVTEEGKDSYDEYSYRYVAGTEMFNDILSYRVKNDIDSIEDENENYYYSTTADGIFFIGVSDPDADDEGYSVVVELTPPILFLKSFFCPGDTWSTTSEQVVTIDGVVDTVLLIEYTYDVSESAPVSTPAGIFQDCIRIVEQVYDEEGPIPIEETTLWLARSIGVIKEEHNSPDSSWSLELQYYSVDGATGGTEIWTD